MFFLRDYHKTLISPKKKKCRIWCNDKLVMPHQNTPWASIALMPPLPPVVLQNGWCKYLCTVHTMRTSEHSAKRHASAEQCATCRLHSALCDALQRYAAHCAALNWAAPTLEIDEDESYCRLTLKPPIRWFMQNGLCLWQKITRCWFPRIL